MEERVPEVRIFIFNPKFFMHSEIQNHFLSEPYVMEQELHSPEELSQKPRLGCPTDCIRESFPHVHQ